MKNMHVSISKVEKFIKMWWFGFLNINYKQDLCYSYHYKHYWLLSSLSYFISEPCRLKDSVDTEAL